MIVEQQVLCALCFYATGSFQGIVASDEHIAVDQATDPVWMNPLPRDSPRERDRVERGFRLLGSRPGVIGCVGGTMVSIVVPSQHDPTVTKEAYWFQKQYYALNVMVVCDANCQVMCIDPCNPGSVHDSFAWRFSWLRDNFEQGWLIDDDRFLLGDSGFATQEVLPVEVRKSLAAPQT